MPSARIHERKQPRFVTLCGRKFSDADPAYFPHLEYRGRTIYFCTEACREAFLADPDVFYRTHRNLEVSRQSKNP